MIIKEIKLNKGLIFKKEGLVIISDEGKSEVNIKLDNSVFDIVKNKLQDRIINNINDFEKLCDDLADIDMNIRRQIETGVLNSSNAGWKIINKDAKQIPRPMCLILKKNKGIKEFYLISLNAKNFDGAVSASRDVSSIVEKKLNNIKKDDVDDEDLLDIIKEAIDKVFQDIDFELRICIGYGDSSSDNYLYSNKTLNEQEQLEYVKKLINKYELFYVENPFHEGKFESYIKLTNEMKNKCLICLKSRINEYTESVDKHALNAAVINYDNFKQFNFDVKSFKENNINIIADPDINLINIFVGFNIPIIKFYNDKISEEATEKLINVTASIKEKR